jgi:two-component system, chemotaxis family, CheB/CheR fusion protein
VTELKKPKTPGSRRTVSSAASDNVGGSTPASHSEAVPEAKPADPGAETGSTSASGATTFPVVGIGASAGGIAAFEAFFAAMPPEDDTGLAFVVVQHLSPDHKSVLVDLIKRYTRMEVREAEEGLAVQPHCTYIIPPNHNLSLVGGVLHLARHDNRRKPRLTVDHFFASLSIAQRERAIAIVMSGTGSDGTLGIREIKGEGGLVIAQAPDTCEYDGMPRSAIATGMVDFVLPPADMPAQLLAYVRHAFDPARKVAAPPLVRVRAAARADRTRLLAIQGNHAVAAHGATHGHAPARAAD